MSDFDDAGDDDLMYDSGGDIDDAGSQGSEEDAAVQARLPPIASSIALHPLAASRSKTSTSKPRVCRSRCRSLQKTLTRPRLPRRARFAFVDAAQDSKKEGIKGFEEVLELDTEKSQWFVWWTFLNLSLTLHDPPGVSRP